jgi:alginate O-acetyltransferase complex protein AlgI
MLFNSIQFAFFLPIIFVLYWSFNKKNLKLQNLIILIGSYYFYSCWNWKFLFLLIFSTLLDYISGLKIEKSQNDSVRKFWFWLSIILNLGFLGIFKYYNFFAESFADLLSNFGLNVDVLTLQIILPVGISFYTFHGLSYVIDVYKNQIRAERNFIDYSVFVSFFPLLVAGPIERATHLLPQIKAQRYFNYGKAIDGLRQILWGLFKKVVIADQCAEYANLIFNNYTDYTGSTLLVGGILFAFQIYGDFSGYSDIALGTARLFGFELLQNFSFPYFSRDIAEFWRRWHISLSTWFRDYIYIPLGGSKVGNLKKIRNTLIIFLVSGFWHGANWTFVIWGFLNALYIFPLIILRKNRNNISIVAYDSKFPTFNEFASIILTFFLTVIAWIFFRSNNISMALDFFSNIFSTSFFTIPQVLPIVASLFILLFIYIEWIGRRSRYAIQSLMIEHSRFVRWSFYFFLISCILFFSGKQEEFIYFQF